MKEKNIEYNKYEFWKVIVKKKISIFKTIAKNFFKPTRYEIVEKNKFTTESKYKLRDLKWDWRKWIVV